MRRGDTELSVAIGVGSTGVVGRRNPIARCSPEFGAQAPEAGEIWIVGSEPVTLLDIEEMLEAEHCPAVRVMPAILGWTEWRIEHEPRLLILDVDSSLNAPAIPAAKRILERWSVPLIVLTGLVNEHYEEHYQRCAAFANAVHVLKKPFREQDLLGLVRHALARIGTAT